MNFRSRSILAAAAAIGLALLVGPACLSMNKATVEERLLALEKNEPLRGRIETLQRRVTIGGEELVKHPTSTGRPCWARPSR